MPIGMKFNDPAGTSHQIQCENICEVEDPMHGGSERKDIKGVPFDVYYEGSAGKYACTKGMPKCNSCSHLIDFFATLP